MTIEEAREVALIFDSADSGCPVCAIKLYRLAEKSFPYIPWGEIFKETWEQDLRQ